MRLSRGIRVTAIVVGSITLTLLNYTGAIALTGPAYTATTTVEDAASPTRGSPPVLSMDDRFRS